MSEELKQEPVEGSPQNAAPTPVPVGEQTPELNTTEKKAYDKGWRPKDEFTGDAWIDAEEFLGRAPLYEGLTKQGRRVKQLEHTVQLMAQHNKKVEASAYARAREELKDAKVAAHEANDYRAVVDIEEKEREIERQANQPPPSTPRHASEPAEFSAWRQGNGWYDTNEDMRGWADGYGKSLVQSNPGISIQEVYASVSRRAREVFPHQFGTQMPNRGHPSNKTGGAKSSTTSEASLTDDQRTVMKTFVDAGVMTKDEYIKQISEVS